MVELTELIKRIVKYLVEGFIIAIAAYAVPQRTLKLEEIFIIALTGAATFAILDTFTTLGQAARSGAGAGIGLNLVGFPA